MSTQTIPTSASQQNLVITTPLKRTSKVLCGFGIAEIVFSIFLFSSCIWTSSLDNELVSPYFGFASAIFHTVLGGLAIIAARDLDRSRGCLISCLVMGIVGSCIFVVATITADSIQWVNYGSHCRYCYYELRNTKWGNGYDWQYNYAYRCMRNCLIPGGSLFFPILFFSIIEAIVGIVLSGIACCKLCSCCNQQRPSNIYNGNNYTGYHLSTAPVTTFQPQQPAYPQHLHVNYHPPNYPDCTPSDQSAIAGIHRSNAC